MLDKYKDVGIGFMPSDLEDYMKTNSHLILYAEPTKSCTFLFNKVLISFDPLKTENDLMNFIIENAEIFSVSII